MEHEEKKSAGLRIICPKCNSSGIVPWEKMKGGKLKLKCAACGDQFPYFHERREHYRKMPMPIVRYGPIGVDYGLLPSRGFIIDLSMSGLQAKVDHAPEDEYVNMSFQLPPVEETIKVSGKIVWLKPADEGSYQMGVNFTHIDLHSKKLIGFFLLG